MPPIYNIYACLPRSLQCGVPSVKLLGTNCLGVQAISLNKMPVAYSLQGGQPSAWSPASQRPCKTWSFKSEVKDQTLFILLLLQPGLLQTATGSFPAAQCGSLTLVFWFSSHADLEGCFF